MLPSGQPSGGTADLRGRHPLPPVRSARLHDPHRAAPRGDAAGPVRNGARALVGHRRARRPCRARRTRSTLPPRRAEPRPERVSPSAPARGAADPARNRVKRRAPSPVSRTMVRGRLPTKPFSISTTPPSCRRARCTDSVPSVMPTSARSSVNGSVPRRASWQRMSRRPRLCNSSGSGASTGGRAAEESFKPAGPPCPADGRPWPPVPEGDRRLPRKAVHPASSGAPCRSSPATEGEGGDRGAVPASGRAAPRQRPVGFRPLPLAGVLGLQPVLRQDPALSNGMNRVTPVIRAADQARPAPATGTHTL